MAEVQRRVTYSSETSVALYDIDESPEAVESIEQFIAIQKERCAECAGSCGLQGTVEQFPNSVPEESLDYQFFGIETDGTVTIARLECDSPHCEQSGIIGKVADEINDLMFVDQ